jgi:hypothetical protein
MKVVLVVYSSVKKIVSCIRGSYHTGMIKQFGRYSSKLFISKSGLVFLDNRGDQLLSY